MTVRIGIIEDTLLHGGTQMWSVEAARFFCDRGAGVTVISPEGRWVAARSREAGLDVASYDYDSVPLGEKNAVDACLPRDRSFPLRDERGGQACCARGKSYPL